MNSIQKTGFGRPLDWLAGVFLYFFILSGFAIAGEETEKTFQQEAVGHVQFVIGADTKILRNNAFLNVEVDMALYSEDALVTGDNSFIHSKMNDGALISIRPQSHLQIDCYQSRPEQGDICLKFTLLNGQVRKVSGKSGKEEPTKYRLNTPVAAIGIRGTDYIASAQGGVSLVRVVEGAITVSPFVEGCNAQGFGECHTSLTTLLTEHDTYLLRILSGQEPERVTEDLKALSSPVLDTHAENEDLVSSGTSAEDKEQMMNSELKVLKDNAYLIDQFIQSASGESLAEEGGGIAPPAIELKRGTDLVFGTWNNYTQGISQPYDVAKQGREVIVGNASGALWRSEGVYSPPGGKLDYQLSDSHAYVINSGHVTPAEVVSGSMSIDFDAQNLKTSMRIVPDGMRAVAYTASHDLSRTDGAFVNNSASGRMGAGAVSNDGSQVGYMLRQDIGRGILNANTLWDASSQIEK